MALLSEYEASRAPPLESSRPVSMSTMQAGHPSWRRRAHPRPATRPFRLSGLLGCLLLLVACGAPALLRPRPQLVASSDLPLNVPDGFQISVFASQLEGVRFMTVSPDGDLYAAQITAGRVVRLPDRDGDGLADRIESVAEGLNQPHSLAFRDGYLYIAETDRVTRRPDPGAGGAAGPVETVAEFPGGPPPFHFTRTIAFDPAGLLYVSLGATCNACQETEPRRAAILQFEPDDTNGRIFAHGLRNAVGLAFHPTSGELWVTNNGRDLLGDDVPPDTVDIVRDGQDFGWPRCPDGRHPDPEFGGDDACAGAAQPVVELPAHSAPLGLAFTTSEAFPSEYRDSLLVALHGSWNRSTPSGYKVVRLPLRDGLPTGQVLDFVTGWLRPGGPTGWGRPVDVRFGPDGSLFISDDRANQIYRLTYTGT
jgi:glucose/arabinose dehydrogenase